MPTVLPEKQQSRLLLAWVLIFLCHFAPRAGAVSLAWDPSPDSSVVGYALYYGTNSGDYRTRVEVGNVTNAALPGVTNLGTYYFVATAYTAEGVESLPSNEVSYTVGSGTPSTTPVVTIVTPNPASVVTTTNAALTLTGTASDDLGVTVVRWTNRCNQAFGVASGTASWTVGSLPLCLGSNLITVLAYDADGNSDSTSLTAVRNPAVTCSAVLGYSATTFSAAGGITNVILSLPAGCSWSASSPCGWLGINPAAGTGPATLTVTAAANLSTNNRSCVLILAGQSFAVSQSAASASVVVSPPSLAAPVAGTNLCVTVSLGAGQSWIASSAAEWIQLSSNPVQSGPGTACFDIAPNPDCYARSASVTVAGQTIPVFQGGRSQLTTASRAYTGLFTNGTSHVNSGGLTLKSKASGTFSGKLYTAGGRWSFRGQFDTNRAATVTVLRADRSPLLLQLRMSDCDDGELLGTVSDGLSTATLLAYPNVYAAKTNPCPFAGSYTFIAPGVANGTPAGHGYGSLRVASNGTVRVAGAVADNSKLKLASWLSPAGQVPFYVPLYARAGSAFGWLTTLEDAVYGTPHGLVTWTKPANPTSRFYPAGFTNQTTLVGSRYRAPVALLDCVTGFTNGVLQFTGANLNGNLDREISVLPGNLFVAVPSLDPDFGKLSLRMVLRDGRFKGTVSVPSLGRSLKYQGAVLQDFQAGYGFCVGTNQTGEVIFSPRPE